MGVQRDPRKTEYDLLRFALLWLVICAHFLEQFRVGAAADLYKAIYLFHMPAFVYLSGRFAKGGYRRVLRRLVLPYVIFQILYQLFESLVLSGTPFHLSLQRPYWLLWYLMAMIVYGLITPILPSGKGAGSVCLMGTALVFALAAGYADSIGYTFSLSRTVVFFPFYLLGYYGKYHLTEEKALPETVFFGITCGILILCGTYGALRLQISDELCYGSYSYALCGGHLWQRAYVMAIACLWILFLEWIAQCLRKRNLREKLRLFSVDTMPVYLLHGFAVRYAGKCGLFHFGTAANLLLAAVLSTGLLAALGLLSAVCGKTLSHAGR